MSHETATLVNSFLSHLAHAQCAKEVEQWLGQPGIQLKLMQWKIITNINKRDSHSNVLSGT